MTRCSRFIIFIAICPAGITSAIKARDGSPSPEATALLYASLWLGFIISVAMMEGWIKSEAPFLPRHFALDIGRTIFSALQTAELAFAVDLLVIHLVTRLHEDGSRELAILIALAILLLVEMLVVTPRLERRADHAIFDYLSMLPDELLTTEQRELRTGIQNKVLNSPPPSVNFQWVYIIVAIIKIVLLGVYSDHYYRKIGTNPEAINILTSYRPNSSVAHVQRSLRKSGIWRSARESPPYSTSVKHEKKRTHPE